MRLCTYKCWWRTQEGARRPTPPRGVDTRALALLPLGATMKDNNPHLEAEDNMDTHVHTTDTKADTARESQLASIWRQGRTPVVYRPPEGDIMVKLPYRGESNRGYLAVGRRSHPEWDQQHRCWLLPRSCFSELVERLLDGGEFPQGVYVIQPHNAKEVCAPACWNARRLECECSCLGKNHGGRAAGGRWYTVSETFAVRWAGKELRWSLLKKSNTTAAKTGGVNEVPRT